MQEMRKRGSEVTRIEQSDNISKVIFFYKDLWYSYATKEVDFERERKRHKDDG